MLELSILNWRHIMELKDEVVLNLLHAVGELLLEEGEQWRLEHPELMDAYNACWKSCYGY